MSNQRGQALIECVGFLMAIALLLGSFLSFTKWFLIRQRLVVATREAALLYSSGRFTKDEVSTRVKSMLSTGMPALPSNRISIYYESVSGFPANILFLDRIRVQYRPASYAISRIQPIMEEKCTIKHAVHYGPSFQTFWGPPVPR